VLLVLLGLALPAMAGGVKNTTYVKFSSSGTVYDSYWKMNPNGLVHEWRTTDSYHFVFKPAGGKFTAPDCDAEDLVNAFSWTFNYALYTDLGGDDGDLTDFLTPGASYYVCWYNW
jgi:hypothetical protein